MLQNARVTAFVVSELFGENQQGGGGGENYPLPPKGKKLKELDFWEEISFWGEHPKTPLK